MGQEQRPQMLGARNGPQCDSPHWKIQCPTVPPLLSDGVRSPPGEPILPTQADPDHVLDVRLHVLPAQGCGVNHVSHT